MVAGIWSIMHGVGDMIRAFQLKRLGSLIDPASALTGLRKNGPVTRASLAKDPADVQSMFDNVAARYDLTNDVLSMGQDRYWRREVARAVAARPGQRVLDLAAGTGTSSVPFAGGGRGRRLQRLLAGDARRRARAQPGARLRGRDATALPFADDSFDAVTISFGLRNVVDVGRGPRRDAAGDPARADDWSSASSATPRGRRSAPSTWST